MFCGGSCYLSVKSILIVHQLVVQTGQLSTHDEWSSCDLVILLSLFHTYMSVYVSVCQFTTVTFGVTIFTFQTCRLQLLYFVS